MSIRSYVTYTGNGTDDTFSFSLGYLDQADVSVLVNALPATFTWLGSTSIKITPPPPNGQVVKIIRSTPIDQPRVDFVDGANLTEVDLDKAVDQNLYAVQEIRDDVDFWTAWIQDQSIAGNLALPPISGADDSSFLVANGSVWTVFSLSAVKSLLGIGATAAAYTLIPDPDGTAAVLTTDGQNWALRNIVATRDFLNLGNLATKSVPDYPILGVNPNVGANIGEVFQVVDVGSGVAGLPALDARLLTNIPKPQYIRVEERAAYNVDGGAYNVANAWATRPIASAVVDETAATVLDGVAFTLNVPAGKYYVRARSNIRVDGIGSIRVSNVTDASVDVKGQQRYTGAVEQTLEATGQVTYAAAKTLKVEITNTGTWSDTKALGTSHGVVANGQNIYTILELWKLPS
jgi:hypothetical protein